jgi:hypothetical protein
MMQKLFFSIAQAGVISDAPKVSEVLTNVMQFVLSVFGVLAVCAFIVSGMFLLFSTGDPKMREKGKRAFQYSIVGVIVALSALIIVTFIDRLLS